MPSLIVDNISFSYGNGDVISSLSFSAEGNEKIAILGSNGSGKSTLMKLIKGLLPLKRGEILINGKSIREKESKQSIGIVFQDPDSQFVSPVLEEDIAFGPENYGMNEEAIDEAVEKSLKAVGLWERRKSSPYSLSGGEKERAQLAGILSFSPSVVILDEAFSMLDRKGQDDVESLASSSLESSLVITITHSAEEALSSDRVILLSEGKLIADGETRSILTDSRLLESAKVKPPFACRMRSLLLSRGLDTGPVLTETELLEALCRLR